MSIITTYLEQQQDRSLFWLSFFNRAQSCFSWEETTDPSQQPFFSFWTPVATETRCSAAEVARQPKRCRFLGHLSSGGSSGAQPASPSTPAAPSLSRGGEGGEGLPASSLRAPPLVPARPNDEPNVLQSTRAPSPGMTWPRVQ